MCLLWRRVCSQHGQALLAFNIYDWMRTPAAQGGAGLRPTVFTYTAAMRAALAGNLIDRALKVTIPLPTSALLCTPALSWALQHRVNGAAPVCTTTMAHHDCRRLHGDRLHRFWRAFMSCASLIVMAGFMPFTCAHVLSHGAGVGGRRGCRLRPGQPHVHDAAGGVHAQGRHQARAGHVRAHARRAGRIPPVALRARLRVGHARRRGQRRMGEGAVHLGRHGGCQLPADRCAHVPTALQPHCMGQPACLLPWMSLPLHKQRSSGKYAKIAKGFATVVPDIHVSDVTIPRLSLEKYLQGEQDLYATVVLLPAGHAYAAAISACAVGSAWPRAVQLFDEMRAANIQPDVVSCTALISALGADGQWQRAETVIRWMHEVGGISSPPSKHPCSTSRMGRCMRGKASECTRTGLPRTHALMRCASHDGSSSFYSAISGNIAGSGCCPAGFFRNRQRLTGDIAHAGKGEAKCEDIHSAHHSLG